MEDQEKKIVLIGSLFDSEVPEKQNTDIMKDILASANGIEDLILKIKCYAGRYALLYKNDKYFIILHDALALREIYYCTKENQVVCGSQPNLITKYANPEILPTDDPVLLDFYKNHLKKAWWIGDETYYDGVRHLLPNHYLDIKGYQAHRYWPNEPIKRIGVDEAVAKICMFLKGTMRAFVHRHSVMIAVTSGMDSRTLLAASRDVCDKVYYFINNHGLGYDHPDISVPQKIFNNIGVPFHVHEVPNKVDEEFRQIFFSNTFFASERLLPTIYNVYFKNHSQKVNILGIGEIGRTRYGKAPKNLNSYFMAYKIGYTEGRYVIEQCEKIRAELLPVARKYGINVLTLLYWEQMMGNWGAVGNSESDIAIEEFDPYACHMLYETFLGVEDKYTEYNNPLIFKEMIRKMWPELLSYPISPAHKMRDKLSGYLKNVGVGAFLKEVKYQVNYLRYISKARMS